MDPERGRALDPIVQKFDTDFGVKVTIETPEKITRTFPIAAQVGKGPDIVIWAHDKVGEWADSGLIAPVEISSEFREKFFPDAWQAVLHENRLWGYPVALETVTLIYNKALFDGPLPTDLSQLASVSQDVKSKRPGVIPILWDSRSPFYMWGILASDGGYVFAKNGTDYDLKKVGVAASGVVDALSKIISLIQSGVLPKSCSYSETEDSHGAREARDDDFRAVGMVEPDPARDRFRVGSDSGCERPGRATFRRSFRGLPQSLEPKS
jgi:maltose/maltodextrin transport system substrate-binding protein